MNGWPIKSWHIVEHDAADPFEAALFLAIANGASEKIAKLYAARGERAFQDGNEDEGCFYLTQAYVFALEAGSCDAAKFHAKLMEYGREA